MKFAPYCFDGDTPYKQGMVKPDDVIGGLNKKKGEALLAKNREKIAALQEALYAEGTQSLLIIFQAMDAAGKDGAIKHVFTGVNPQGIVVSSFKRPTAEDLNHDFLWRAHKAAPSRGMIGIFNRSHYEDVLISRVLDLPKGQPLPPEALEGIWKKRYRQINDFERMLHENGTTVLKFYLHLSKEEQTRRFLARAEDATKNWKFSMGDLETSEKWDAYMKAFEKAISETATANAPWWVVPADRKWYARLVVSQVVLRTLRQMNPAFPATTPEQLAEMEGYRALAAERLSGK